MLDPNEPTPLKDLQAYEFNAKDCGDRIVLKLTAEDVLEILRKHCYGDPSWTADEWSQALCNIGFDKASQQCGSCAGNFYCGWAIEFHDCKQIREQAKSNANPGA